MKSKAALKGLSLSDYILREIEDVAERPTTKEIAERLARLPPVKYKRSPAEILREERARRDRALGRFVSMPAKGD